MIINGKTINGIFKHNEGSIFTQGDIVLKGSTLYVALTETPGSIDPSDRVASRGYYKVYLGDQMSNLDDLLNNTSTLENLVDKIYVSLITKSSGDFSSLDESQLKTCIRTIISSIIDEGHLSGDYLSKPALVATLSHYLTGVTMKGTLQVLTDDQSAIVNKNYTGSNQVVVTASADEIIRDEFINHAIYAADRRLPGLPIDIYSDPNPDAEPTHVLLRQYTYEYGSEIIRIQELIDQTYSILWYRFLKIPSMDNPSEWRSITLNDYHIHDNIQRLANEYKDRIRAFNVVVNELRNNFRYRKLNITDSTSFNAMNHSGSRVTLEVLSNDINSDGSISNKFKVVNNITIDLSSNLDKYRVGRSYIKITTDDNEYKIITLYDDEDCTIVSQSSMITNVYLHEFYG